MVRNKLINIFITFASLAILTNICFAQRAAKTSRERTVDAFHTIWLIQQNESKALGFFHKKALSDRNVFNCDCCNTDDIDKNDEATPAAIKTRLTSFLKEPHEFVKGKKLADIISLKGKPLPEVQDYIDAMTANGIINRPKRDKYYLASYKSLLSTMDSEDKKFLKSFLGKYNVRGAFISLVQFRSENSDYNKMGIMMIWVRSNKNWKAVSISPGPCQ